jgi:hypothetical protein
VEPFTYHSPLSPLQVHRGGRQRERQSGDRILRSRWSGQLTLGDGLSYLTEGYMGAPSWVIFSWSVAQEVGVVQKAGFEEGLLDISQMFGTL